MTIEMDVVVEDTNPNGNDAGDGANPQRIMPVVKHVIKSRM